MLNDIVRKIIASATVAVLLVANWSSLADGVAMAQADSGMKRALASFAVARALNAAISLAQGTEFSAGLGAHITFSVGEILDPVNDMVESFSNLMLLASVSFGIQKVLLMIGQDALIKWMLTGAIAGWSAFYLLASRRYRWLDVTLVLMLMVRFAVPVVTLATDAMYQRFLAREYERSTMALEDSTDAMNKATKDFREQAAAETATPPEGAPAPESSPAVAAPDAPTPPQQQPQPSLWDNVTGALRDNVNSAAGAIQNTISTVSAVVAKIDPRIYIDQLKDHASKATDHIIQLMVVFVLQTLLVPLFLLWAMYTALRGVLAGALVS